MLKQTLTHYAPWDLNATPGDPAPEFAVCGARIIEDGQHATQPNCPTCVAYMLDEDYRDEANAVLNAQDDGSAAIVGITSAQAPRSFGAELVALAVALNRRAAKGGR